MVENKRIAIIPARGGSKRIPRKNVIDLKGKPMIVYTIEAALKSGLFSRIIVSTDDKEIADVAKDNGAEVPFFRKEAFDDMAPVSDAVFHALKQSEQFFNESYTQVVQLMPNCPMRDANDIVLAIEHFESSVAFFQISCFRYGWMNPWWAHELDENNVAKPVFPSEMRNRRSQDQPDLFCPTGAIWIADVNRFKATQNFYGEGYTFYPMPWDKAIDIDDLEDLKFARVLMQHNE